jgi:uncharacterized protein (DUF2132 family)
MNEENEFANNPLNGVGLKQILQEIIAKYDFAILYAYLGINCFKTNPSYESSFKFLKKTTWAREKVEAFYLYEFKNLPEALFSDLSTPPRERIIPLDQKSGDPRILSFKDAELRRQDKEEKSAKYLEQKAVQKQLYKKNYKSQEKSKYPKQDFKSTNISDSNIDKSDPWATWKGKRD